MKNRYQILMILIIVTIVGCKENSIKQTNLYDIGKNQVEILPDDTDEDIIRKAAHVTPSKRQYEWQKLEFTAFIHYGSISQLPNYGFHSNSDITHFSPKNLDVKKWVDVIKDAGMKMVVLTTKHHDGFCLWPSKYTDFDISNTPYKDGKGDIVGDLAKACADESLKFGVYLSPWDMYEPTYGTDAYNEYFINQITELLTQYGSIAEVWFDGAFTANGKGPNGKIQTFRWNDFYKVIRKLQPDATIAIMGPDIRWVGTESGYGRSTEWSVLPGNATNQDDIASNSQQESVTDAFIPRNLMGKDLGSRKVIKKAKSLVWYPTEIDVSIRPSWIYKEEENDRVKTPQQLIDIYYNSVGMNGVLLLNLAPDADGKIHETDIKSLKGMRYILDNTFDKDKLLNGSVTPSDETNNNVVKILTDGNNETYWSPKLSEKSTVLEINLDGQKSFNTIMLQENILEGQRIEKFKIEYFKDGLYIPFASGTTIGYKRLLKFSQIHTDKIRLTIEEARATPQVSTLGLYMAPPEVSFEPGDKAFYKPLSVRLFSDTKDAKIYYTTDGTMPTTESALYTSPIKVDDDKLIQAIAVSPSNKKGIVNRAAYAKAKYKVLYNSSYSMKYKANEDLALVDGLHASTDYADSKWQGFLEEDVDIVIDLGKTTVINKLSSSYLNAVNSFIFLPQFVEYSFSYDGKIFTDKIKIPNSTPESSRATEVKEFATPEINKTARYIKLVAKNVGICPDWHIGKGDKAWLFVDEVTVN